MKYVMGIDPGKSGGIALVSYNATPIVTGMGKLTEVDIFDFMLTHKSKAVKCFIENVHSMPGQGVKSVFSFGKNYGFLRGVFGR